MQTEEWLSFFLMVSLKSVTVLGFPEYTRIEVCTRSVKFARENVLLKKCTELNGGQLNGGHLEHIALEYKKQVDPHHVLALYVEYNKLVVSEFSLNLKRNL